MPTKAERQKALEAKPSWGSGERTDWGRLNKTAMVELQQAPKDLQKAWGRGGPQGIRGV